MGAGAACAGVAVMVRPPRVTTLATVMVLMRCVNFMPSLSGRSYVLGMSTRAHSPHVNAVAISSALVKMSARNILNRLSSSIEPGAKLPATQSSSSSTDPIEK